MIRRILKYAIISLGCPFFILILLSLTSAPFWTWYGMSTKHAGIHRPPDFIIVLGGGGMPSESGLMRTWYAGKAGDHFPRSKVIIALPGDTADSLSSVCLMKQELLIRGISAKRISFESEGTNTRAQALNIKKIITNSECSIQHPASSIQLPVSSILIITSPEHLYRAVLSFRKAGFLKVDGMPAFETAIESELSFNDQLLGGKKWVPSVGKNITVRYLFWTQMHYEQLIIREWLAIVYYKLNGWI
ncbi:MAG: YdcF family protein [Bacteroidetes bacterium]|nr:YdcF family protein [Bacteroidota bacterium]